jgi:hydrogenase maturation protein HypF
MAENHLEGPALGVSWDGTGYGLDGTIWGGEFIRVPASGNEFERFAHLRTFRLPGGEIAVREPRRSAIGLLYEIFGGQFGELNHLAPLTETPLPDFEIIMTMLKRGLNGPVTSSAGRLFDAVAAIVGLRQRIRFEGQAAMQLEFALHSVNCDSAYPFELIHQKDDAHPLVLDWSHLIQGIIDDLETNVKVGIIAAKFHNALVEAIVAVARLANEERVILTGGCFQNQYLTERAVSRLAQEGFRPYWHQRIPTNDGGIALGQIVAAQRQLEQAERLGG